MAGLRWHRFLALARPDSELPVRRSELRAPRKPFSSARHVDREALTPHPELGAQVVRGYMFSCGQTRPKTICQASVGLRRCQQGQAMARHVLLELELDQAAGRRTQHAPRSHSPRTPIALAFLMASTSVACRSSSPGRTSANMPAAARPGTFDGSATRRSPLSAFRVSVALRVSCTSRC